jgi:lambda family phage minor tail protein L
MPYAITTSFKQELVKLEQDQLYEMYVFDIASVVGYVTFDAATKTITSNSLNGLFPTDRIQVGDTIEVSGTASNNGEFTVTVITSMIITVSQTVVDESNVKAYITNYAYIIDDLVDIYYYKMQAGSLIATNQLYTRSKVKRDDFETSTQLDRPMIKVSFSNINRVFESLIQDRKYLRGCFLYIITSFKKFFPTGATYNYIGTSPDKNSSMIEKFIIESASSDEQVVQFNCGTKYNLREIQIPRRTYGRAYCSWAENYAGPECDPDGAINTTTYPTCDGTLKSCRQRDNSRRYGGFPGIPKSGAIGA